MVDAMKEELKIWISFYGTQMVLGYAVGSAKWLKPVTISAVENSAVDQNANDDMAETAAKSLLDKFLHMGTKCGGWNTANAPHWSRSSTSKGHEVGPNRYLCAKIGIIWAAITKGDYKDEQMASTQLEYHANMLVVGKYATIINHYYNRTIV